MRATPAARRSDPLRPQPQQNQGRNRRHVAGPNQRHCERRVGRMARFMPAKHGVAAATMAILRATGRTHASTFDGKEDMSATPGAAARMSVLNSPGVSEFASASIARRNPRVASSRNGRSRMLPDPVTIHRMCALRNVRRRADVANYQHNEPRPQRRHGSSLKSACDCAQRVNQRLRLRDPDLTSPPQTASQPRPSSPRSRTR